MIDQFFFFFFFNYFFFFSAFPGELVPILNERAGFPPDTELVLFEEIKPNLVEQIENQNDALEKVKYKVVVNLETKLDGWDY